MLIYKAIIDSYIRHKEFISANNVLRMNNYMKIENKISRFFKNQQANRLKFH